MDGTQGVYISVSNQSPTTKVLVATSRDTWAECKQDLRDIFGDEFADQISALGGAVDRPILTVVSNSEPTPQQVVDALGGGTVGETEKSFEICECGYAINRWVAPGVSSKTGKPYSGFFACSNPTPGHKGKAKK